MRNGVAIHESANLLSLPYPINRAQVSEPGVQPDRAVPGYSMVYYNDCVYGLFKQIGVEKKIHLFC